MRTLIAWSLVASFALLSLLHVYWALGGRQGAIAVLPERDGQPLFRPGAVSSSVMAGLLAAAAILVAARAGFGPGWMPVDLVRPGVWTVGVVMLLRALGDFRYLGFFKRIRGTSFARWDSRLFSPVALLLGLGTCWIAAGGR